MQYVKECLQLLYWIYFKPYTLKQHVQAICPEITNPYADNIFRRSAEARANPQLQRYDDQGWWLAVVVPIAGLYFLGLLIEVTARLTVGTVFRFNWLASSLFLLGWLFGQLVFRVGMRRMSEKTAWVLVIVIVFALSVVFLGFQQSIDNLFVRRLFLGVVSSVVVGILGAMGGGTVSRIVAGTALGMSEGSFFCMMDDILFTMSVGVEKAVALGVMNGAVFGMINSMVAKDKVGRTTAGVIAGGITLGVLFSGWKGTAVGVALGVSFNALFLCGTLRLYFWLPELVWTTFLKFAPVRAAHRLSCLPSYYDQLIVLPLPFISGFIAEAYQENQAAARQTIDYLITSTNQQKTAVKAINRIAAEELSRCQTARDIVAIRNQLDWIADQQSAGLSTCLEISQDVAAALEGSSFYRQAQQLDKITQKIARQRNALATASAREATTFGSVLDSWQRILETARRTLREQAAQSDEIPQVYLAGPALDPNKAGPLFKGRRDLFRQIETLTFSTQHPTLVMHGGRRSGKTSTLNYLPKWLPSDILPLLIDGQSLATTSTLSGFAEDFADQIIRSARKVHNLNLPGLESVTPSADSFVTLRRWLDTVEEAVPDKTLLLCLDEFERLDEIVRATDSRAPLNFLRHLIQHRDRWTLLLTGALTPEELPAYWSDYLINCETLRISYLDDADCLELIQRPVEDFPDIYPLDVAYAIWDLTGGQPYFTQLLCHELVEQLNRKKEKIVQLDDLGTVLPAVFERGYQVFREFWSVLSETQQALLLAVAEGREITEEERRAAFLLVRKEVLAQEGNGWTFRVPLLRRWILAG